MGDEKDPYQNHMNIDISRELDGEQAFNEFICEFVIEGLTALAMAVAPELAAPDFLDGIAFDSLCQAMG